jgi:hypothetical protein
MKITTAIATNKSNKNMTVIDRFNYQIMNPNLHLMTEILVKTIAIALIGCMYAPETTAQPTTAPETTPPMPQDATPPTPKQSSYFGFGGNIGIQGSTTSLSQGSFSLLNKHILTDNLAIHSAMTIFGSSVSSNSVALTFNQPIANNNLPIVFTPFVGGGIVVHYDNGTRINPLITGGIDASTPFGLTGTLRINAGFINDRQADVGILFGVGKNY